MHSRPKLELLCKVFKSREAPVSNVNELIKFIVTSVTHKLAVHIQFFRIVKTAMFFANNNSI